MAKVTLVQGAPAEEIGAIKPATVSPYDTSRVDYEVGGSIDSVRTEIDDAYEDMKTFYQREPDEIMRMCRGHSARLSELRVRIMRVEDYRREWRNIRTREIEPTLEELTSQWQNASRLHSVRELDWRMEQGLS